jgi:hypothetical protein
MLPSDSFDKLELIEATCVSKGVKLLILQTTKEAQQDASSNH